MRLSGLPRGAGTFDFADACGAKAGNARIGMVWNDMRITFDSKNAEREFLYGVQDQCGRGP